MTLDYFLSLYFIVPAFVIFPVIIINGFSSLISKLKGYE